MTSLAAFSYRNLAPFAAQASGCASMTIMMAIITPSQGTGHARAN